MKATRVLAVLGSIALTSATSLVALGGGVASAAACTPATTADDGGTTSLRGLLENLGANSCDPVVLTAGATYLLTIDSLGEIDVDNIVTIEGNGATIQQTDGDDNVMETDDDLTLRNVTVTGGRAAIGDGGGVENDNSEATTRIENSTITDNSAVDEGGGVDTEGPLVVVNSTISNNSAGNDGGGIHNSGPLTMTASTVSGNCAEDGGGAIDGDGDDATIVNSTVTANVSNSEGAVSMDSGDLVLVYSDIVANTLTDGVDCANLAVGPAAVGDPDDPEAAEPPEVDLDVEPQDVDEPSNLDMGENTLLAFGSVIASPLIGPGEVPFTVPAFNCEMDSGTPSGYNFSDDATCGFTNTATGDRENAGAPGLGALANNGGPTQTLLPSATSPLLNFIPIAACAGGDTLAGVAVTVDQRGIARPQATGCEIGSVEVQLVVRFTG